MLIPAGRSLFPPAKPLVAQHSKNGPIHCAFGSSGAVTGDKLETAMFGAVWAAFWISRQHDDGDVEPLKLWGKTPSGQTCKVQNIHRSTMRLPLWDAGYPDNNHIT